MKRIIRGLFDERKKKEEAQTAEFFNEDTISKILRLMHQYSFDENTVLKGRIDTVKNFLNRLSYQLPDNALNKVYDLIGLKPYLSKTSLNEFLSVIELFIITLYDECSSCYYGNYSNLNGFIEELNDLLALKLVPFRIETKNSKIFFDRINSPHEEENKKKIYEIVDSQNFKEVNDHFTNSLIAFAKRAYPESIEEAYLALEKYLKIKINKHTLSDANACYKEFENNYSKEFRGIFSSRKDIMKKKVSEIETIRSEIKSHSSKETFDRKEFLEETARFQLNEVMNLIILLNSFKKK